MNGTDEAAEEGEVQVHALVSKVHVRGVDSFTTQDVENYAREHYSDALFHSVQWIDDTSVNLIYDTELAAAEALLAFSADQVADPLEVRPGKRLITHPDVELFVRHATVSDVKVKGASKSSRFYLLHPEHDPENRPKRRLDDRSYRTRDYGGRDYGYKRRRRDTEDERTSRRDSQGEPWNEDLYDDGPASVAARKDRSNSHSSAEPINKRAPRVTQELLLGRQNGRLRDRSASPVRDGDGRYGFGEEQPRRRTARPRSPTPPERRKATSNHEARDTLRKELFPNKRPASRGTPDQSHTNGARELFPNNSPAPNTPRELFPSHKRHDARDLDREYREVAHGISRFDLDGTHERDTYRRTDDRKPRGDLMSRMSGGPSSKSNYGRLQDRPSSAMSSDSGFSIKGASRGEDYSFKGASKEPASASTLPKELFPLRTGGGGGKGGEDLFADRMKGRGSQRRRAEDLF